jgi:A/G-specific adenine glycosylase
MDKRYFSDKVVEWYLQHKRELPWRANQEPYRIWLSEIILQQTKVSQGLPYYLKFLEAFPTVEDLANASEQKVLRYWQGLGYYTRARNLHKCAKAVVEKYNGVFPESFEKLKTLPGIGDYTAAAISSIAFREPVAVVDGNVFRVLSRVFGIDDAINSPEGKKKFTTLANELIQKQHPGEHNQAVMEFGALFCTPKTPKCIECTFNASCYAFKKALQQVLPIKIKAKDSRKRYFYYVVIQKGDTLLMRKRTLKDIWHGLYDFPLVEKNRPVAIEKLISEDALLKTMVIQPGSYIVSKTYKHILTHQHISARFIFLKTKGPSPLDDKNIKFYSIKQVHDLPKPVLITRFLADQHLL